MRKTLYILLIANFFVLQAKAQQGPLYSQYMVNKFLINPAIAGANGYTSVNLVARNQYTGFVNSPQTYGFSAQTRLLDESYIMKMLQVKKKQKRATRDEKIGLGANIYSDKNGIVSKTGVELTYAYHLNFSNNYQLSFGITGSGFQYKLDDSEAYLYHPDDPLLNSNQKSFWVPDAAIGAYFTNSTFYGGVSMNDLFGSALKLGSSHIKDNFRTARVINVISGYRFKFENGLVLEPSALLRAAKLSTLLDINTRLIYQNDYWLGVSYRSDNTMVAMIGASIQVFYFGYAYDSSFREVSNYTNGSHEIMLGLRFGDNSSRRFRWIRQDQINYD